ncbi:MAG: sigma 54-interacting transcriptional regulator [Bacillota bacterium]
MNEMKFEYKFIQDFVDAFTAVIGLNMIVCKNDKILAASGNLRPAVGQTILNRDILWQSMQSGLNIIVRNPGKDRPCWNCEKNDSCKYFGEIVVPVKWGNNSLGALGLVAWDQRQKDYLFENETQFLSLVAKLAKLFVLIVMEKIYHKRHITLKTQLDGVIGLISEGLLIFDQVGRISYSTHAAQKILESTKEELESTSLEKLFPGINVNDILYRDSINLDQYLARMENSLVLVNSTPLISEENDPIGGIVSLVPVKKNHKSKQKYEQVRRSSFDSIKGVSNAIMEVKKKARQVAKSDSTVLIRGESGTGKELFAKAIHNESPRVWGPFITVNCAAIPDQLLESELFGYEEGAFTGAKKGGKIGKFELAHGGTLFLDEIGDMPLSLQSKLLRVLQDKYIERVGGSEPIFIDVRLIAATHKDIEEMVQQKMFREDLFYRINVIPLYIPPLRERLEDLYLLLEYFMKKHTIIQRKKAKRFSSNAINALFKWSWPGNVREVENTIEYIVNFEESDIVELESLPDSIRFFSMDGRYHQGLPEEFVCTSNINYGQKHESPEERNKKILIALLKEYGTSTEAKRKIAEILGVSLATLYRYIKKIKQQGHLIN